MVLSKDTTLEAAFPPAAPFKILYSVYALRSCLVQQSQNVRTLSSLYLHLTVSPNIG